MPYKWQFEVISENWPFLIHGLRTTVYMSAIAMGMGLIAGLLIALARLSRIKVLQILAYWYTEFFRTTPLLVQLMWIFYALPRVGGPTLNVFTAGAVGLTMNLSAFLGEIYRAGIIAVPQGLIDAGLALGFTNWQLYRRITLPIAFRQMMPLTGTLWISLFKDTSVLSLIGTTELMYQARALAVQTYRPLEIFTAVAVIYFLVTYPQSLLVNYLYMKYMPRE